MKEKIKLTHLKSNGGKPVPYPEPLVRDVFHFADGDFIGSSLTGDLHAKKVGDKEWRNIHMPTDVLLEEGHPDLSPKGNNHEQV